MPETTIYYNPKCGSCRKAKELLEKKEIAPKVVEYLKTPPTVAELEDLLKKLGAGPEAITRFKEEPWRKGNYNTADLGRKKWLELIAKNPILLQRPIVVRGAKAVVARPPEKAEEIL